MNVNDPIAYWEDPKRVAEFAARDPDHRLTALLDEHADVARLRALDLGCAGGRNTRYLAERGVRVEALDAAPAMVEATRRALSSLLGESEAKRRARVGRMDELPYDDGAFDLVVALGIYHMARSEGELERALAETTRVLVRGGDALVSAFAPGTRLGERTYSLVEGTAYVHATPDGERGCLLTEEQMDAVMHAHGLTPVTLTETVRREPRGSLRVVVNGRYRKSG